MTEPTNNASLSNRDIAGIFETVADMMQIKGDNIHRILSYRRAAETIHTLPRDLRAISKEGNLTDLSGIGKTIAAKIDEMLDTGKLDFFERLKNEVPEGLVEIMHINGVGPKKAKLFWEQLEITSIDALDNAAKEGKLQSLPGMGKKSEQKILDGIAALAQQTGRTILGKALPLAQEILELLMALPQAKKGEIAGSIRRGRETIGDVDILIAGDEAAPIMDTFVNMERVSRILGHGPTKSSVELLNGLQVDLRVLPQERWGTLLNYFTGSQAHNVRMRQIALDQGYSLNEHALRPIDADGNIRDEASHILCDSEEMIYQTLGMKYIPPELREDKGEIEAAQSGTLPDLITLSDIQADLHMHTTWSDGTLSIQEMAEAARARGRKYIVITDHSISSAIANGLSAEKLMLQQAEIRQFNKQMGSDFHVLHGTEMDIKADGTLDYPDEILEQLDFVIASLHFSLRQDRAQITKRLLNAIQNPHVDMIGHLTARMIPNRPPVDVDIDAVFGAAVASGTVLEINANPIRLDLNAEYARRAKELGILLAINTDAHSDTMMDVMTYGVMTARRSWVEASNVINTWSFEHFMEWVQKRGR